MKVTIIPAESDFSPLPAGPLDRLARRVIFTLLKELSHGSLRLIEKGQTYTFGEPAAEAELAATVIIPLGSIAPGEGYEVLIKALAVCIIGGLGSTGGVILASFIIGFAERFTDTYIGSHWTMMVSLAAILIVLIVKPSGLFGKQKELEERI